MESVGFFVIYVVGVWVTYRYGQRDGTHGWMPFTVWTFGYAAGYWASLLLHPRRACRKCGGSGRHGGNVYNYAWRACTSCEGRGWFRRFGAAVLGISADSPRRQ